MASNPPPPVAQAGASAATTENIPRFEVFKLYVDFAKWLLAIISGLIVFGIDRLKDQTGGSSSLYLFAVAALMLAIAAAFDLWYLLQSFNYLSRRAASTDPADKNVAAALKSSNMAYQRTIWFFAFGLAVYVVFGGSTLRDIMKKHEPVEVHFASGLLIAREGHCMWLLDRQKAPGKWQLLPPVGAPSCSTSPPSQE